MFEVKFGTPKPVTFRECCKCNDKVLDIDLEARFVGKCEVSEYDKSRYANDGEVSTFIKSNCCEILEKCLNNWPKGESVVKYRFRGLDGYFSTELENSGITAKTEIIIKNLTEDSEKTYKELQRAVSVLPTDYGCDHITADAIVSRPEGTYMVAPVSLGFKYKDDRVYYKPGERVDVDYWAVGTDISYDVSVVAPDLRVEYGSVIHISFTMPEHDVYISIGSKSFMTGTPDNNGKTALNGFMGMLEGDAGDSAEAPKPDPKPTDSEVSEWTCPLCGARNKGKFCSECAGLRPSES